MKCPKCNKKLIHHKAGRRENIKEAGGQIVRWGEFFYCTQCKKRYKKGDAT